MCIMLHIHQPWNAILVMQHLKKFSDITKGKEVDQDCVKFEVSSLYLRYLFHSIIRLIERLMYLEVTN